MQERILIIDFGSQTTQLIARRIRDLNVYCEVVAYNRVPDDISGVKGVIFSGSNMSVYSNDAISADSSLFRGRVPLLGICYGAQLLSYENGGTVEPSESREYGRAKIFIKDNSDPLLKGIESNKTVWMSHGDTITRLPDGYKITASTDDVDIASFRIENENTWGVQFHPEIYHSEIGNDILNNFLDITGIRRDWDADTFIDDAVKNIKSEVGYDKVLLALSGGVDSSVLAVLMNKAIGENLVCVFVNNGFLRKNEFEDVLDSYRTLGLNIVGVDASKEFISAMAGISDPETKRKTIGRIFIDVFNREAQKLDGIKWLAQGTIYPDVIESMNISGNVIKSHHNVGGLPQKMELKVIEPLRMLFKDEVRKVGLSLGMDKSMVFRHPFPGPGLSIRIIGEITEEKIKMAQDADFIFIKSLREDGLYDKIWQAGAILLPIRSVGVMGDERTYGYTVALRAVTSTDAMSADWADLPGDFLRKVSNEIINKVRGINRVVYDISSKPPSTIEWE